MHCVSVCVCLYVYVCHHYPISSKWHTFNSFLDRDKVKNTVYLFHVIFLSRLKTHNKKQFIACSMYFSFDFAIHFMCRPLKCMLITPYRKRGPHMA